MKKLNLLILFASVCCGLTACSSYTELYKDGEGRQVYRTSCKKDITNCYEVADSVCERGFVPMEWYGESSQTKLDDAEDAQKSETFGVGDGRMVFRCK